MAPAIDTRYSTLARDRHETLESVISAVIARAARDGLRMPGLAVPNAPDKFSNLSKRGPIEAAGVNASGHAV